ncbi:hypothetical protein [Pedobacter sp. V48]|uniref:hypothetical protein n=1 Tax=Pedobacter sp. V48 TaxID=509635 RepID=UPI0003E4DD9D|nr:hypothetical protein [Pedobacter sp. V48]ETZ22416.1 hypothetical protein N824_01845 [Pedobacter sp. V48]
MSTNNITMQNSGRYLLSYGFIILSLFFATAGFGQNSTFPYAESFRSTTMPTGIALPLAPGGKVNAATFTMNGLVLTPATTTQFGAVTIDGFQFNSTNGIEINFEYSMYGGVQFDNSYGDGISVFLYDASKTPVTIGSNGHGLGYGFNRAGYATDRQQGLTGAYLGIGLDAYGNFKNQFFEDPARTNGITGVTWGGSGRSQLTLRGAQYPGGISGTTYGLRGLNYSGYPVLATQGTLNNASGASAAILNTADGSYTTSSTPFTAPNAFDLRPGALSANPGDANYRKAIIILTPRAGGGFVVNVKIQHDVTTTNVINNYQYSTSLIYTENANALGIYDATTEAYDQGLNTIHTLTATVPASFKIGFAASTGAATQTQLIRDLVVKLPYQTIGAADTLLFCGNYTPAGVINPFSNDVFYNGSLTGTITSGNNSTYVDFSSFIFEDAARNNLGTTYTDPGKGTWSYNTATGLVTFTPVKGYVGGSSVFYSAKGTASQGGPFNQNIYRSGAAMITTKVTMCNTISNPQLPANRPVTSGQ